MGASDKPEVLKPRLQIGDTEVIEFVDMTLDQRFDNHHSLLINLRMDDVQKIFNKASGTAIALNEVAEKWISQKAILTLQKGPVDNTGSLTAKSQKIFTGIVTAVQLNKKDAVNNSVAVSIMSPTILLNSGPNTKTFEEKSLNSILNAITQPYIQFGGKFELSPSHEDTIPYISQYQEDTYNFIYRLAEIYGEWCFYDGEKFLFGKSGRGSQDETRLEYGSNLKQIDFQAQLVPFTTTGQCFNYLNKKGELFKASSVDERVEGLGAEAKTLHDLSKRSFHNDNVDISYQGHQTLDDLKKAVRLRKSEASNHFATLRGLSTELDVSVGGKVKIVDDIVENGIVKRTDFYGTYTVVNVRHYMDSRGYYTNSFEGVPHDATHPPVDYRLLYPKAESQPAKVIDTNDPQQMGRVKVQFYWQKDGETTPWIRVASLMSGNKEGVYFTPEKGEVVFVDFEFGNPDLPFVRGTMYHGDVKPGNKLFQPQNNYKGIITRGGNHIIIDDSSGKEEICIYNRDSQNELRLSLNGNPQISVKSKGKITLEAEEIEMKAKSINMKADQGLTAEANEVKIQGKAQTSVKGSQLVLEGNAQASLKASMVLIN